MNLKKEIDERFCAILEPEGFKRSPGPWLSYAKKTPTIHYHVDVENAYYMNEFTVTLQTVDIARRRNSVCLCDLAGAKTYAYPGGSDTAQDRSARITESTTEVLQVVDAACLHLRRYGLPWLQSIK